MNRDVVLEGPDGLRALTHDEFPLSIGGLGSDIVVPGLPVEEAAAFLGIDNGTLFVQPNQTSAQLVCGGTPVTTSTWLRHGDLLEVAIARIAVQVDGSTLRLLLSIPSGDSPTEPPQPTAPPDRFPSEDPIAVVPVKYSPHQTAPGRIRPTRRSRGWMLLATAGLIVVSAVLWYLLTARSVSVRIEPPPDKLAVSGGLTPSIAGRFLLRPGEYLVEAELPEHRPFSRAITVSSEAHQIFEFNLEPLPGLVTISSADITGAVIEIDGEAVGVTPKRDVELVLGAHEIVIRADRHQVHSETLVISKPGQRSALDVDLVPAWAPISLTSDPPGATVLLDGTPLGTTPMVAEIGAGSHRLDMRLQGYQTAQRRLQVAADEPQEFPVIRLDRAMGRLSVSSTPAGATVTVDGQFAGQTPADLALDPDSGHQIKIAKAGYEPQATTVRIEAGSTDRLEVSLEPLYGEVEIHSTPTGAEIIIDGEVRGTTSQKFRLSAVSHAIEVRKGGFETFATNVVPETGLLETVHANLKSLEKETVGPPATITTSQGAVLRLVGPGAVQLGASRREPGRRANESIRHVVITKPFFLAVHEVTNTQFLEFNNAHNSGHGGGTSLRGRNQPAVQVSWDDAARYCNWLSEKEGLPPVYVEREGTYVARSPLPRGYRLPTEAEWALAARMAGESNPRKYIWGDALPIPKGAGNYGDAAGRQILGAAIPDYDDGFPVTAPVGSFSANPIGIFDLGGNVAEWVHDPYTIYPPSTGSTEQDPTGPAQGEYHVIRGASWMDAKLTRIRLSYRDYGDEPAPNLGFRIALSVQ